MGNNLGVYLVALSDLIIAVPSGSQTQGQAGRASIGEAKSVTKTGAGTAGFDSTNGYIGPTTVAAGTLRVANAGAGAWSPVTVHAEATLEVAAGITMRAPA